MTSGVRAGTLKTGARLPDSTPVVILTAGKTLHLLRFVATCLLSTSH